MHAPTRLADLLAGLSVVSDLGFAMPPESAMRRCIVATGLARTLGLDDGQVGNVYYTALLQHIGCIGFAHETAAAYGDEMAVNAALARGDEVALSGGAEFGRRFAAATCEVGGETARRLGLGEGVQLGLRDVVEVWDGSAGARGLRGEQISLGARISAVAAVAALQHEARGVGAAEAAVRGLSGGELDPEIAAAFLERSAEILGEVGDRDPRDVILDIEPAPGPGRRRRPARRGGRRRSATSQTSSRRTRSATPPASRPWPLAAGERLGLDEERLALLEVAGLLHDVGRVGISNVIWERPGPLTRAEWEQVRLHPYHSERVLVGSEALGPAATVVGMHHERLDGSGYHRGAGSREIGIEARILAAADAFDALTHDRPHRPARPVEDAARELRGDADSGRLDPDAVEAVVAAAGLAPTRRTRARPPGLAAELSDREVEVLQARGARALQPRDRGTPRRLSTHG